MAFSASDAAFEGFRIVRRRPLAMLMWALAYIVFFALAFLLAGSSFVTIMQQVEALEGSGATPTMENLGPLFQAYGIILLVVAPLSIIVSTMLSTAIARAVVRPKDSAFGYLRLGMDELRVFGAMVVMMLLIAVYYVVVFGVVFGVGAYANSSGQGGWFALALVLGLAGFCGLIWLAVRLSLMVPIIVAEKRFTVLSSLGLTKGRFWPLLGMALLAFIMAIVVAFLGWLISMPLTLLVGGSMASQFAGMEGHSMTQILPKLAPILIVSGLFNAVVSALQLAIMYAPFAEAYRQIKGLDAG